MKKKYLLMLILALFANSTYAQFDQYLGEIRMFATDVVPKGWMKCEGQPLDINRNQALFSILGTFYGGDGIASFNIPDLRERMPVGVNQSNRDLSTVALGQINGISNTLTQANLPIHIHVVQIKAASATGNSKTPSSLVSVAAPTQVFNNSTRNVTFYNQSAPDVKLPTTSLSISSRGQGAPVSQLQPCLSTNYYISTTGIYPSRN